MGRFLLNIGTLAWSDPERRTLNIAPIVECINDLYQIRSRKDGRKWVYDILPVGYYMSFEKNEENFFKALFRVEIVK